MADDQGGAGIVGDHFFQQVECLQIEIVGGLVQHKKIRRRGEQLGQQQPCPFAARQHLHRRAGLLWREEKVLQVIHHMAWLARHHHHVAAAVGDGGGQRLFGMQRGSALVELGDLQALPQLHIALVRLQLTQQQLEQRRLADAVRPHHANTVAAMDPQAEVLHNFARAIRKGDALGVNHLGAAGATFGRFHFHVAQAAQLFAPLGAHAAQSFKPPDIALAPRGDAIAHPMFFLGDAAFQLVALQFLFRQLLVAPELEMAEAFFQPVRAATIQPHRGARQGFQEEAVMADQHQRPRHAGEFAFQPFDGRQVEMVGGLVQQQHIGARRQHARQRGAAGFAARQGGGIFVAGQAQRTQQVERAVGIIAFHQPRLDIFAGAGIAGQVRLLGQVADGGAGLGKAVAAIRLDHGGGDLEQGRFARAVAPHQAEPVARAHRQFRPIQQLGIAETQLDVGEMQKR